MVLGPALADDRVLAMAAELTGAALIGSRARTGLGPGQRAISMSRRRPPWSWWGITCPVSRAASTCSSGAAR